MNIRARFRNQFKWAYDLNRRSLPYCNRVDKKIYTLIFKVIF